MATEDEVRRLILEVLGVDKVSQLQDHIDNLNESMGGGGGGGIGKGGKSSGGGRNLQQNFTAASYALQDFASASGDVGQKLNSITNNIPGILAGLGGLATGISVAVVAAVSLYRNWDAVIRLMESKKHIPKETGEAITDLTKEIHNNREAMEKLEKQTSQTFAETEKYSLLVTKTAIAEANLLQAKKELAAFEKVGKVKPEEEARGAAFAQGAHGFQEEIMSALGEQGWDREGAQGIISGAAMGDEQMIGLAMEAMGKSKKFPRKALSHIRAGMPGAKEQFAIADEITKSIQETAEDDENKAKKAAADQIDKNTAQMKAIQDAEDVMNKEKKEAHAEKVKADHAAAAAAKRAANAEGQRARHEAGLLEDAFGDQARFRATQMLGGGMSPAEVQKRMANQFMMSAGATRLGAERAAENQMEKVLSETMKNGGLASSLLLQQGRLQRVMLEQQNQIRGQLMQAEGDLRQNWDNAFRRGK